jgi:hypothetical protein
VRPFLRADIWRKHLRGELQTQVAWADATMVREGCHRPLLQVRGLEPLLPYDMARHPPHKADGSMGEMGQKVRRCNLNAHGEQLVAPQDAMKVAGQTRFLWRVHLVIHRVLACYRVEEGDTAPQISQFHLCVCFMS